MMNSKTVSLKDKKLISEKLRNENKKMEVRLQQLKLTMIKEKEDRLLSGNSPMWSTGAPGAVLNYKPNLFAIDRSKKVKLKMLKEEDDTMLHSRKGPTEKHSHRQIFNEEVLSNRSDNVSRESVFSRDEHSGGKRKCGQCEEVLAAVNCNECTEVYCARCFAAFHLKGALRKHRSTPISNLSNRVSIPSPLFKPPNFKRNLNNSLRDDKNSNEFIKPQRVQNDISDDSYESTSSQRLNSKENQSPKPDGQSLGNGDYDEALSNQYFQDALVAWRSGEEPPYKPSASPKLSTTEHATETLTANANQQLLSDTIKFTSSLSYAEKLLLRKHRSCQLKPVEMKYILSRLAKNNEAELLENQKLLQSNLKLEASAVNATLENGFLSDDLHVDIECLTQLWSDAALLNGGEPRNDVQLRPSAPFVSNTGDCINEFVGANQTKSDNTDGYRNQHNYIDESYKVISTNSTFEEALPELPKLKLASQTTHSAVSRKNFNDRPQSARRMSARNDRGGKITTKPSALLNILACFNDYLPSHAVRSESNTAVSGKNRTTRPSSADTTHKSTKLNYNFYKISPQSWKPSQAWSDTGNQVNVENEVKTFISTEEVLGITDEYDEELRKLDFFSHLTSSSTHMAPAVLNRSSSSSSTMSGNDNVLHNVEMDLYHKDEEEQESQDQLASFERELTTLSCKQARQNHQSSAADYEEILADSLDLMASDNFQFDSLDLQQRYPDHLEGTPEDFRDSKDNCSSRFDDYDDVHNLH